MSGKKLCRACGTTKKEQEFRRGYICRECENKRKRESNYHRRQKAKAQKILQDSKEQKKKSGYRDAYHLINGLRYQISHRYQELDKIFPVLSEEEKIKVLQELIESITILCFRTGKLQRGEKST